MKVTLKKIEYIEEFFFFVIIIIIYESNMWGEDSSALSFKAKKNSVRGSHNHQFPMQNKHTDTLTHFMYFLYVYGRASGSLEVTN